MRSRARYKSERRETRRKKACFGMRISGRSIKSVLLPAIAKRHGEDTKTGRVAVRNQELEGATKDRRKEAEAEEEGEAL